MTDGPIYRSPDDVAEAIAVRHERINTIIRTETELGVYAPEDVRELGRWTI